MTPPCWLPDLPNSSPQNALLTVRLIGESDFVLSRQRAKQIAALLGFENQDQTRIATAVSEIARNAYEYAGGGRAEFFVDRSPQPQLRIVISDKGKGIDALESIYDGTYTSASGMGLGIMGARRLLDSFDLKTSPQGTVATLIKRIPENKGRIPSDEELVERLPQRHSDSRAAMADQNHELMTLLADLRLRESELTHLNQELEETNRGVLVLYAELEDKSLAVQHASEMKTRFLSGVTHELRTPLNSIVSLSRLLLHRVDGELNAEQEKQVGFILRSAQTLSDMVNDLLDMAKIEAGKTSVKLSDVNVHDTLAGLRGMFRSFITNPGVDLVVVLPEGPDAHSLVVHTDEGKLAQILRNFISNALKYTSEGRVVVKAERVEDNIVFSVADTGIGIAPEHHELVMQEWGQVESAMQNRHKGSGLGLPLSRSLAEVLGGSIHFTSTPGVGSTFYLTLPAQPAERKGSDSNRRAASVHILMADDDEVARYLLRRHRHRVYCLVANSVRRVPYIQRHPCFARHHVHRARLSRYPSRRSHQPLHPARVGFHRQHPLRCGQQRILAQIHRCRARMVRFTVERELHPRLSRNALHHAQRLFFRLQHRPLLNVNLEVSQRLFRQRRFCNPAGVQPESRNRLTHAAAMLVRPCQQSIVQPAHQRPAPQERHAEPRTLFL